MMRDGLVGAEYAVGQVFSRDCPQYECAYPEVGLPRLVNHFKSQSGGGGEKRKRQATEVRRIAKGRVAKGEQVVVVGGLK
jgi:hypothetical protein